MTKLEKMRDELAEKWWLSESLSGTYDYDLEWVFKQGFDASTAYHAEIIQELVKALHGMNNEVAAMVATHGYVIAQDYGITNLECLEYRLGLARQALESVRGKL